MSVQGGLVTIEGDLMGGSLVSGYWRFEVTWDGGNYFAWWETDGNSGGDPVHYMHSTSSMDVQIKGTWHGTQGLDARWWLTQTGIIRHTPEINISSWDTAVEGGSYSPGQEPGFTVTRMGDHLMSAVTVALQDPESGTAQKGIDYAELPTSVVIPQGQSQVFIPLSALQDEEIEWTEWLQYSVIGGSSYKVGYYNSATATIVDDDPVEVRVGGATASTVHLLLNIDDDDSNTEVDGWQDTVYETVDDDLTAITLHFQDEAKAGAEVVLSLDSRRFRVWLAGGDLLLGGPDGPMQVVLDPEDGPEMTVFVEALPPPPEPPPGGGPPPPVIDPAPPAVGTLTLKATDANPRPSNSEHNTALVGTHLLIQQLVFSATVANQFHPVFRDNGNQDEYDPPHWLDADLNGRAEREFPVAYRREATMRLGAGFKWSGQQGLLPSLQIRGTNPEGYDFLADIADPTKITINGQTLSFTDDAAKAFADTIEHFDTFDLTWEYSIDNGVVWTAAGETKNQVYTLLENPVGLPELFHTLAHVSSRAAQDKNAKDDVINSVWGVFEGEVLEGVKRADGTPMKYYGSWLTNSTTTASLLKEADGTCEAWVRLFLDMLKAHGIRNEGNYVEVRPNQPTDHGLIIKNWTFGPGQHGEGGLLEYNYLNLVLRTQGQSITDLIRAENPTSYNWAYAEAIDQLERAGQGNKNPASLFAAHALAKIEFEGGAVRYFDVPYGQPAYQSIAEWRDDAIAGYWKGVAVNFDEAIVGEDVDGDDNIGIIPVWRYDFRRNLGGNHIDAAPEPY